MPKKTQKKTQISVPKCEWPQEFIENLKRDLITYKETRDEAGLDLTMFMILNHPNIFKHFEDIPAFNIPEIEYFANRQIDLSELIPIIIQALWNLYCSVSIFIYLK